MDSLWEKLTHEDKRRISGLSSDLYSLDPSEDTGEELPEKTLSTSDLNFLIFFEITPWQEWRKELKEKAFALEKDVVAYLRGRGWELAGFPEAGLEFYREAARIQPDRLEYAISIMRLLWYLERKQEAMEWALSLREMSGTHLH